jgi:hypothetical protein
MVISNLRLLDVGPVTPADSVSGSDQAEPTVEIPAEKMNTHRALARRLNLVLFGLGLDEVVPNNWVMPTEHGFFFADLSVRQADRLIRALEDMAADYKPETFTAGPDQLGFFDGERS